MAKPTRAQAVLHNRRLLESLNATKVLEQWRQTAAATPLHWFRYDIFPDWFLKELGLEPDCDIMGMSQFTYTFETREWWMLETQIKQADEDASEEERRSNFDKAKSGLLEATRLHNRKHITQSDTKLFLFENRLDLSGDIAMLTLAVNESLGTQAKRESIDDDLREQVIRKAHGKCASCDIETPFLEIDHITPVARGGTNNPENLQALCPKCNGSKGVN